MTVYQWPECSREILGRVLPEALVILPVGAVEQHGPHLPTGTDTMIVHAVAEAAATAAQGRSSRDLILAPTIPVGASDHHFPFGATLSLTIETATAVLVDFARSVREAGSSRLLFVNGHGGNRGPCHGAAQLASTRYGLRAAYVDYWSLVRDVDAGLDVPVPGHAGAFETSLVEHLAPDLVGHLPARPAAPPVAEASDVTLHTEQLWRTLDGYTDTPDLANESAGQRWFDACASALADRIVTLAASM